MRFGSRRRRNGYGFIIAMDTAIFLLTKLTSVVGESLPIVVESSTPLPIDTHNCIARPDGIYADQYDCHRYYHCVREKTFYFRCFDGFIFDPCRRRCIYQHQCISSDSCGSGGGEIKRNSLAIDGSGDKKKNVSRLVVEHGGESTGEKLSRPPEQEGYTRMTTPSGIVEDTNATAMNGSSSTPANHTATSPSPGHTAIGDRSPASTSPGASGEDSTPTIEGLTPNVTESSRSTPDGAFPSHEGSSRSPGVTTGSNHTSSNASSSEINGTHEVTTASTIGHNGTESSVSMPNSTIGHSTNETTSSSTTDQSHHDSNSTTASPQSTLNSTIGQPHESNSTIGRDETNATNVTHPATDHHDNRSESISTSTEAYHGQTYIVRVIFNRKIFNAPNETKASSRMIATSQSMEPTKSTDDNNTTSEPSASSDLIESFDVSTVNTTPNWNTSTTIAEAYGSINVTSEGTSEGLESTVSTIGGFESTTTPTVAVNGSSIDNIAENRTTNASAALEEATEQPRTSVEPTSIETPTETVNTTAPADIESADRNATTSPRSQEQSAETPQMAERPAEVAGISTIGESNATLSPNATIESNSSSPIEESIEANTAENRTSTESMAAMAAESIERICATRATSKSEESTAEDVVVLPRNNMRHFVRILRRELANAPLSFRIAAGQAVATRVGELLADLNVTTACRSPQVSPSNKEQCKCASTDDPHPRPSDSDHCRALACFNGAMYLELSDGQCGCLCARGWTGDQCQHLIDPNSCHCANGGRCVPVPTVTDQDGQQTASYACACPLGYVGGQCQYPFNPGRHLLSSSSSSPIVAFDTDDARTTPDVPRMYPCDSQQCGNGGVCLQKEDAGDQCYCPPGFTGDLCQHKV